MRDLSGNALTTINLFINHQTHSKMKRICKILALLFVVALTATATGYASEADTGYQPPTVVQTVMADMPVAQEYAFLGWDAGMAVTYADQQVCPNIVLQPVAGECPNDLWEWRCMAITDGHLNQGSFCRSVAAANAQVQSALRRYVNRIQDMHCSQHRGKRCFRYWQTLKDSRWIGK